MNLKTRDFGTIEISQDDIVTFVQPIFGFEEYTEFVFLYDDEISEHFAWLQSVTNPDLCFILTSPQIACPDYRPNADKQTLSLLKGEDYECWLVTVIHDDFSKSTVNLKSPVLECPETRLALQTILDDDLPIRYPFVKSGKENV